MEARRCTALGRGFTLVSTGEEKLWIPSKLIKVRFEEEKLLEEINDNSLTRIIITPKVREIYRLGAGFSSCLHRRMLIFKRIQETLDN